MSILSQFDIVLLIKNNTDGLNHAHCMCLYGLLKDSEAYPIEILSTDLECSAMGFIGKTAAKTMDYYYEELFEFVKNIMSNPEENKSIIYTFKGLKLYLSE